MISLDTIYNEDCLIGMQKIQDKSIDCIICDLPFGQTKNEWDSVIPFEPLWKEYERIIKDNGAIILFAQGMFTAELMLSNKKLWRYNLVWKKGNRISGFLNSKRQPLRNHEDICVFYKKQPTYNPQMTTGKPLHSRGKGKHRLINNNYGYFNEPDDSRANSTDKYPISILNFSRPHPAIFPTQKPVELIQYLIRTYTNEGDIVLDNCIGSGTTALACIKEKRHYIGFEINKNYVEISQQRINKEKQ